MPSGILVYVLAIALGIYSYIKNRKEENKNNSSNNYNYNNYQKNSRKAKIKNNIGSIIFFSIFFLIIIAAVLKTTVNIYKELPSEFIVIKLMLPFIFFAVIIWIVFVVIKKANIGNKNQKRSRKNMTNSYKYDGFKRNHNFAERDTFEDTHKYDDYGHDSDEFFVRYCTSCGESLKRTDTTCPSCGAKQNFK